MACKPICKLCNHLVISTNVVYDATDNQIVVTLPGGTYNVGEKYCLVIAQAIPATAAISAPVMIKIGTVTTRYPVNNCDCTPLTACGIRTRTRYSTVLQSSASGAVFKMLGKACCCPNTGPSSISG